MSRDKKWQLVWYQVNDSKAMARRLEQMAARGWLLEKVSNWGWFYRRGEPGPVRYAITYFPEASIFDAALTQNQETYVDYCRAAGWELAAAYGPIQYFRSTRPDASPIETDEAVKLETIRRSMGKTFVLGYALLLVSAGLNLFLRLDSFRSDPLGFVSRTSNLTLTLLLAGMAVYCAAFLLDYLIWVILSQRAVARGGACAKVHTRARLWSGWALMAVCAVTLAGYVVDFAAPSMRWILFYSFAGIGLVLAGSQGVLYLLKRRGCSRETTRAGFVIAVVALSLLYAMGIPLFVLRYMGGTRPDREPAYVYTGQTSTGGTYQADVYLDALPVTLEELGFGVTESDHYSYEAETVRSPLAAHSTYSQAPANWDSGGARLTYEVCAIRWGWLRRLCWETLAAPGQGAPSYYRAYSAPMEPPPGALAARRTERGYHYALLGEGEIVLIDGYRELTEEQVERIAASLLEEE